MFKFIFFLLLLGGWALAGASLYVVRTPANMLTLSLLPKNELTFDDTYVDTRQWTLRDVPQHRDLVRRLMSTGRSDVLAHLSKDKADIASQLSAAIGDDPAEPSDAPSPSKFKTALAQIKSGKIQPEALAKMLSSAQ